MGNTMVFDLEMIRERYNKLAAKVEQAKAALNRPLSLTEKILYSHLFDESSLADFKRGADYVDFRPDRVAMQDATAQMALLQFIQAGKKTSSSAFNCSLRSLDLG